MIPPELQSKLAIWRTKQERGELTQEEMREAIALLRGSRRAAAEASASKRSSATSPYKGDAANRFKTFLT